MYLFVHIRKAIQLKFDLTFVFSDVLIGFVFNRQKILGYFVFIHKLFVIQCLVYSVPKIDKRCHSDLLSEDYLL